MWLQIASVSHKICLVLMQELMAVEYKLCFIYLYFSFTRLTQGATHKICTVRLGFVLCSHKVPHIAHQRYLCSGILCLISQAYANTNTNKQFDKYVITVITITSCCYVTPFDRHYGNYKLLLFVFCCLKQRENKAKPTSF